MPKKKLTVAEIEANPTRFRLLQALKHEQVMEFVVDNFGNNNLFITFFKWFMLGITGAFACYNIYFSFHGIIGMNEVLWLPLAGIIAFLVLIPIHEGIHAISLKIVGAPQVKFGMNLKQLAFFAEAPDFVAGRSTFIFIAITPFVIINSGLIVSWFFLDYTWAAVLWGVLLMHSFGCVGDFALMGYYQEHSGRKIYSFDKSGEKTMYFYEEVGENSPPFDPDSRAVVKS